MQTLTAVVVEGEPRVVLPDRAGRPSCWHVTRPPLDLAAGQVKAWTFTLDGGSERVGVVFTSHGHWTSTAAGADATADCPFVQAAQVLLQFESSARLLAEAFRERRAS